MICAGTVLTLFDLFGILNNIFPSYALLPELFGYLLLFCVCVYLREKGRHFSYALPLCVLMVFYTAYEFFIDYNKTYKRMHESFGLQMYVAGAAAVLVSLLLYRLICLGVRDMERGMCDYFGSRRLLTEWYVLAGVELVGYALYYYPAAEKIFGVIAALLHLAFVISLFRAGAQYRESLASM